MYSGSFLVFCVGKVVEKERFDANERLRNAAVSEAGKEAILADKPAIVSMNCRPRDRP